MQPLGIEDDVMGLADWNPVLFVEPPFFLLELFLEFQAPSWNSTLCEKWRNKVAKYVYVICQSWKKALRTWLEWQEYHDQGGPGLHPWSSWSLMLLDLGLCDTEGLSKLEGLNGSSCCVYIVLLCVTFVAVHCWRLVDDCCCHGGKS